MIEYTDIYISINPFAANPGYWQMCVVLSIFFARTVSLPPHDKGPYNRPYTTQFEKQYIAFDFQYNSSKSVNPALTCTTRNVGCVCFF